MPEYLNAASLLADARLRIEAYQEKLGVLVVEGPDDRRLFYTRVKDPSQIIAAGGRTLLLSAYDKASREDLSRMVFLTDCDYAVRRGEISGGSPSLIITVGTTIESDILDLGTLAPVVMEVVPTAVTAKHLPYVCDEIVRLATLIALPIGRVRMAIQSLGIDVGLAQIDHVKYWSKRDGEFDTHKLNVVVEEKLRREGIVVDLADLVSKTPSDNGMCNGKDLVAAIRFIMHSKYRVGNDISVSILTRMLRLAITNSAFESWSVVRKVRRWEAESDANLLATPGPLNGVTQDGVVIK